ncbi:MAG: hypothetical protein MI975_09025 [Cytophagales bacterium]|nr:hypothetical protein [Cytophagales bacterium]
MKISNILIAFVILFFVACSGKRPENNHGHEHGTEAHRHPHDEQGNAHEHAHGEGEEAHSHEGDHSLTQEEFTVEGDSAEVATAPDHHVHEDGSVHQNH